MNHSQWKTRRTRKLLGESVEESPAYVEMLLANPPPGTPSSETVNT